MTSWKCRHRSMQPMRIASGGLAVVSSKTGINHARGSGMQIALLHGYKLARTVHRLTMPPPTQRRPLAELKKVTMPLILATPRKDNSSEINSLT